jgi:integrase
MEAGGGNYRRRPVPRRQQPRPGSPAIGSIPIRWRALKRAAFRAGLDPAPYAGHSLRAGFCTQAYLNGAPELSIMRQSRHQSLDTVRKYIRDRSLFRDNPAAKLGL